MQPSHGDYTDSYRERIVHATFNQCPDYNKSTHETVHLFNDVGRPWFVPI